MGGRGRAGYFLSEPLSRHCGFPFTQRTDWLRSPFSILVQRPAASPSHRSAPTWRFRRDYFESMVAFGLTWALARGARSAMKTPSLGSACSRRESGYATSHPLSFFTPFRWSACGKAISWRGGLTKAALKFGNAVFPGTPGGSSQEFHSISFAGLSPGRPDG